MKPAKNFLKLHGWQLAVGLVGCVVLFLLLWYRLGSLTHGHAASLEVAASQIGQHWQTIAANPLNGPYTLLQRLVYLSGHHGITSLRLVSTVWALAAGLLFYSIVRRWHGRRVAALATWLFISSSWFLHTARLASPDVLWLVSGLALVLLFSPPKPGGRPAILLPSMIVVLAAVLYVPGMVWLVFLSILCQPGTIGSAWRLGRPLWLRIGSLGLGLVLLAPLVRALVERPQLIRTWAAIPATLQPPQRLLHHFLDVPVQLFARGPSDPVHWLGQLPVLSAFVILMILVGGYFYVHRLRSVQTQLLAILAGGTWLLIGLGGIVPLSLIVPIVYLVAATGIAYLLRQWLTVFPRNPIARGLGIALLTAVIVLTSIYNTRSYFVAWRYNPATVKAFQEQL